MLQMNVNIVQTFVENVSSKSCRHQDNHERQDVLHISGGLKQNNSKGDCHSCHTSKHRCCSHQRICSGISKSATRMIEFVKQMPAQPSESSSCQKRGHKQTTWYGNSIDHRRHRNVRNEKQKQRPRRKCCIVVSPSLTEVEQLLDSGICLSKDKTGNFVVLLFWVTLEWYKGFNQILFLVTPILHVLRQFCASAPKNRQDKRNNRNSKRDQDHLEHSS
mmetsp:Transcript_19990/g.49735  ORF Transcript_19990/g.49735 Transcript_19990/m.49735 type:complete len:218 (+) Transcript_19990:4695-5348(+)